MHEKRLRVTECKAEDVDRDANTMVVRISTDCVDRMGEVLMPGGALLDNFRKNPVILWAHDGSGGDPGRNIIGRAQWVKADKHGVLGKVEFAAHEDAQRVFNLYADGFLKAWSVGFLPIEGKGRKPVEADIKKRPDWAGASWITEEWELLEFSAVAVPANPEALSLAVSKGLELPAGLSEPATAPEPPAAEPEDGPAPVVELGEAAAPKADITVLGRQPQTPESDIKRLDAPVVPDESKIVVLADGDALAEKVRQQLRGRVYL